MMPIYSAHWYHAYFWHNKKICHNCTVDSTETLGRRVIETCRCSYARHATRDAVAIWLARMLLMLSKTCICRYIRYATRVTVALWLDRSLACSPRSRDPYNLVSKENRNVTWARRSTQPKCGTRNQLREVEEVCPTFTTSQIICRLVDKSVTTIAV